MKRFGFKVKDMREINHDSFILRVKSLIIMYKALLGDYSLQEIRLKAFVRNADEVSKVCDNVSQYFIQVRSSSISKEGLELDYIFYHRVSFLATMAKSIVAENPIGYHREKVIRANIEYVSEALHFNPQEKYAKLLRVA